MELEFVLASRSPRRRELLTRIGIRDFIIDEADIDEAALSRGLDCRDTVTALAAAKAAQVAARHKGAVIIGADTVVSLDGQILGKPADNAEARAMLKALSGREHSVMSGVCVITPEGQACECETTVVRFRKLSDREIDAYIAADSPLDKAGAYGIQGLAALFVEGIVGDYYNVMGLPLYRLGEMLRSLGAALL